MGWARVIERRGRLWQSSASKSPNSSPASDNASIKGRVRSRRSSASSGHRIIRARSQRASRHIHPEFSMGDLQSSRLRNRCRGGRWWRFCIPLSPVRLVFCSIPGSAKHLLNICSPIAPRFQFVRQHAGITFEIITLIWSAYTWSKHSDTSHKVRPRCERILFTYRTIPNGEQAPFHEVRLPSILEQYLSMSLWEIQGHQLACQESPRSCNRSGAGGATVNLGWPGIVGVVVRWQCRRWCGLGGVLPGRCGHGRRFRCSRRSAPGAECARRR